MGGHCTARGAPAYHHEFPGNRSAGASERAPMRHPVFRLLYQLAGDLVGPLRCAACDQPLRARALLCNACAATVERWCGDDDPWAYAQFGGALAQALRRLKYGARPDLGAALGELVAASAPRFAVDVVVPVPVPWSRLVDRGYNQAALLARPVAAALGAPLAAMALWRAEGAKQASLGRSERLVNLKDALRVRRPDLVRGRTVLLVDDVSTTGATVQACRDALLAAEARCVRSIVVARAERGTNLDRPGNRYPSKDAQETPGSLW